MNIYEPHGGVDPKHLARAGGLALMAIASTDGLLYETVEQLKLGDPSSTTPPDAGSMLSKVLPPNIFESLEALTGLSAQTVSSSIVEQLRRVAIFAGSDGGPLAENMKAAERLIRSGRVELFRY